MTNSLRTAVLLVGASIALCAAASCTPGKATSGLAKPPAIPDAEKCDPKALNEILSPYVIEWPAGARSDLEAAMKDNVVVINFSCDKVTVLPDCKVKGGYGYQALTPRTETTLIEGRDNIKLNFGGVSWAASGSLERDAKLDLQFMLVGKQSTIRTSLHRDELEGGDFCKGATHFVKRADIGAFAFATGSHVAAGVAAKVFGVGAEGGSESKDMRTKRDGDPTACKVAKQSDTKAPENCGASIRVSIAPIKDSGPTKAESLSKVGVPDGVGCPAGSTFADGACTKDTSKAKAILCEEKNEAQCQKYCLSGSDVSCDRYARITIYDNPADKQMPVVMQKIKAVQSRFVSACEAHQPAACTALALFTFGEAMAAGGTPDKAKFGKMMGYMKSGCFAGDYVGCAFLKGMASDESLSSDLGINIKKMFADAINGGCKAGNAVPCGFAAFESSTGFALKKDPKRALDFAEKACLGSFAEGCAFQAGLLSTVATCTKAWEHVDERLLKVYQPNEVCDSAVLDAITDDAARSKSSLTRACSLGIEACK